MDKTTLEEKFTAGELNQKLEQIYGCDFESQKERYLKLVDLFELQTGQSEFSIFSTAGRTELMGNHTDHNFGCVLAASVQLDTLACAYQRNDSTIEILSEGYPPAIIDLEDLAIDPQEKETTQALIRGIAARFKELGYKIGGWTAVTTSGVPGGSGLSSSAAIEVLIGTIFSYFYNDGTIDPVELAKIGQWAENNYFMKPCGLMDQVACAHGGIVKIDFANPAEPIVQNIDFKFRDQGYALMVVDTGGSHADLTDEYAAVPTEMKKVASLLGKSVLRECTKKELFENVTTIRKEAGDRAFLRALHFLNENDRPAAAVDALKKTDMDSYLKIVLESGESSWCYLQNCTSVKDVFHQGVTTALAIAREICPEGTFRVHGGGFAGTIQCYVPEKKEAEFKTAMDSIFGEGATTALRIRCLPTMQVI